MKTYQTQQLKEDNILTVICERKEFSIQITESEHGFVISAAFPLIFTRYSDLSWEINIDDREIK